MTSERRGAGSSAVVPVLLVLALLSLTAGAVKAGKSRDPGRQSSRVARLRLDVPVRRPSSLDELALDDTSSIVIPDTMTMAQFLDSDRYFAHFPTDRAVRIDGHTRQLEFWLSASEPTAEFVLRISALRVLKEFRARRTHGRGPVVIRWDLRDSTGVRLPPGGYSYWVQATSGPMIGGEIGVIRVRP